CPFFHSFSPSAAAPGSDGLIAYIALGLTKRRSNTYSVKLTAVKTPPIVSPVLRRRCCSSGDCSDLLANGKNARTIRPTKHPPNHHKYHLYPLRAASRAGTTPSKSERISHGETVETVSKRHFWQLEHLKFWPV